MLVFRINVQVVYATPARQYWLNVDVEDGATVRDVLNESGILKTCPEIDLTRQKVGIFGKPATLDTIVDEVSRIEIYRPITADPATVVRKRPATGA